jgi:hypothetical protein
MYYINIDNFIMLKVYLYVVYVIRILSYHE